MDGTQIECITPGDTILFHHLHKCAGNSFRALALQNFRDSLGRVDYADKYYSLNIDPAHPDYYDNWPPEKQQQIRFVWGHFQNWNTRDEIERIVNKPYVLCTLVRYPIDRVLSAFWFYTQSNGHNDLYHQFKRFDLGQLVTDDVYAQMEPSMHHLLRSVMDNYLVRCLAGITCHSKSRYVDSPYISVTEEHLQAAINNLEHNYSFVETSSNFSNCGRLLEARFGWSKQDILQSKKNENRLRKKNVGGPELIRAIEDMNRYDLELYNWVLKNKDRINTRPLIRIGEDYACIG